MLTGADVALARISQIAYNSTAAGLPAGFFPVTQAALGLNLTVGDSYSNGLYQNQNGAAMVLIGTLNGQTTAIIAFRGSDDRQDSINDLQNVNREYQLFPNLIAAVDAWVAKQGIGQVVVTGHSLGGSMDQLFMTQHGDNTVQHYLAETFGSPGAVIAPGTDNRITNIRISDDPAVYLGENRAAVGAQINSNPALAAAAIFAGPEVFPGLQPQDVLNSLGSLDTNYVNRGQDISLPDANGLYTTITGISSAVNAGKSEHLIGNYVSRIEAVTGSTGDDQQLPGIAPTTTGTQIFRFFDTNNGTHFYTASATERDATIASRPDLTYEGFGLNGANPATDSTAAAVYRFFDTSNGSHLYTTSQNEAGSLSSNTRFTNEGVAFYEDTTQKANTSAVYRFFDTADGSHFYTASATERASIFATRPDLINEGIAFYTQSA